MFPRVRLMRTKLQSKFCGEYSLQFVEVILKNDIFGGATRKVSFDKLRDAIVMPGKTDSI
jgi:hypothetical protein